MCKQDAWFVLKILVCINLLPDRRNQYFQTRHYWRNYFKACLSVVNIVTFADKILTCGNHTQKFKGKILTWASKILICVFRNVWIKYSFSLDSNLCKKELLSYYLVQTRYHFYKHDTDLVKNPCKNKILYGMFCNHTN